MGNLLINQSNISIITKDQDKRNKDGYYQNYKRHH